MSRLEASLASAVLFLLSGCNHPPTASTIADDNWAPQGTWVEVWRDDFEGVSGSAPDPTKWTVETNGRPPNAELEYYTARRENSFLDGDGHLVLRALMEDYMTRSYTSARMNTRGKFEPMYGRIEARMRLPAGKGFWPAFWMLGSNGTTWPARGEIDVMEEKGSDPTTVHGSLHGPNFFGTTALTNQFRLSSGTFADDFHVFAVEWTQDGIRWLVDEEPYHVRSRAQMAALGKTWVFDGPFYILVNLAVGGNFDGAPNSATPFPSDLTLDYVKASRLEPGP
jgi:beta-glucanase (GH16 family)